MLGYYGMSLTGRSHLANGTKCQDAHKVKRLGNHLIVAAIADGLGSKKYSEIGSTTAVETVLRFIENNLPPKWHEETLMAMLRMAYNAAFKAIRKIAEEQNYDIMEYDTTLTTLIYNGVNAVYGHVGDGGIITLSRYGEYSMLTSTQKGEEHNMTAHLRMGPDFWVFGSSKESICGILMMTDGIYDIACPPQFAKREQPLYINFIRPFMDTNVLLVKTEEDFRNAETEIKAYFNGDDEEVKCITDDKTIVAVINTDEKPELKSEDYYSDPDFVDLKEKQRKGLYGTKIKLAVERHEPGSEPLKSPSELKSLSSSSAKIVPAAQVQPASAEYEAGQVRQSQIVGQKGQYIDIKAQNVSSRQGKRQQVKKHTKTITSVPKIYVVLCLIPLIILGMFGYLIKVIREKDFTINDLKLQVEQTKPNDLETQIKIEYLDSQLREKETEIQDLNAQIKILKSLQESQEMDTQPVSVPDRVPTVRNGASSNIAPAGGKP